MPFGKHKGDDVCDLPQDYLLWLVSNIDMRKELKEAVVEALEEQGIIVTPDMFCDPITGEKGKFDNSKFQNAPTYLHPDNDMKKILVDLVDAGYKSLAKKAHPDKGGKKEDMQALNSVKEWLQKGLGL